MPNRRKLDAIAQIEWMRNLLAFLLVGAFISMLPLLAFVIIPQENKDIITYMVGQLSGMAITVLGFYFVSKVGQDAIDAKRTENTGKLADLATTAMKGATPPPAAVDAADQVAAAAQDEADAIGGERNGT